jgi:hypothetical protein
MCIVLIGVQIIRIYPIWTELPEDPYQGAPLKLFQSLVERGTVTLDVLGQYRMLDVMIYKNGERCILVEEFPVTISVMEGDVLETWVLNGLPGVSLVIKKTSDNIELKYSRTSLPLTKGLHRIGKVVVK